MTRLTILLALFLAAGPTPGILAFPTLHTIADLTALQEATCRDNLPFCVTGKVEATLASSAYILADGTGRMHFRQELYALPATGTVVAAAGVTGSFDFQRIFLVTNLVTIGRTAPTAPTPATAKDILGRKIDYRLAEISGTVIDVCADDVNENWDYLAFASAGETLVAAVPTAPGHRLDRENLLNAGVTICGVVLPDHCGQRNFIGPHLELSRAEDIRIVTPPPPLFDAPPLRMSDVFQKRPEEIAALSPRKILGRALAVWGDGNLIFNTRANACGNLRVRLVNGQPLPPIGAPIEVVGQPGTDIFNLTLSRARWRSDTESPPDPIAAPTPRALSADCFRLNGADRFCIDTSIGNCLVSFAGTVATAPAPAADGGTRVTVDCGDYRVELEVGPLRPSGPNLQVGDRIRATGIAVIEIDDGRPGALFPTVRGLTVVVRSENDVRLVARAPWWTPFRLSLVILTLLAIVIILSILSFILKRLVERRSLQLAAASLAAAQSDIKTLERTRLATELHDSISQTLAGVSLEIEAARRLQNDADGEVLDHLDVAANTLQSCRSELRNCLWDLRSQAIDEPTVEAAISRTLTPHLTGISLDLKIDRIRRMEFPETTLHAVLQIVRELTLNAIRHGKAMHIAIEGRRQAGRVLFSVTDDGSGFDVDCAPGLDSGHFGLQGIRERLALLKGTFSITSVRGRGTHAEFSVSIIDDSNAAVK